MSDGLIAMRARSLLPKGQQRLGIDAMLVLNEDLSSLQFHRQKKIYIYFIFRAGPNVGPLEERRTVIVQRVQCCSQEF